MLKGDEDVECQFCFFRGYTVCSCEIGKYDTVEVNRDRFDALVNTTVPKFEGKHYGYTWKREFDGAWYQGRFFKLKGDDKVAGIKWSKITIIEPVRLDLMTRVEIVDFISDDMDDYGYDEDDQKDLIAEVLQTIAKKILEFEDDQRHPTSYNRLGERSYLFARKFVPC